LKGFGIDRHVHVFKKEATIFSTYLIIAQIFNTKETGDVSKISISEPC